jgi:hypothetical protein
MSKTKTPSRRRNCRTVATAFVLDNTPAGNLDDQKAITRELRRLGVSVPRLLDTLEVLPARRLLIQEARSAALEGQRRPAATFVAALSRAFTTYDCQLARRGGVPDRVALAYGELIEALSLPSNTLSDTPVNGYASERRALNGRQRRIKPGAPLGSVQRGFMPEVRVVVWRAIMKALGEHTGDVFVGERYFDVDRHDTAAFLLTARFVRAFFPTWGATTTPQLVRKQTRNLPRFHRSK